MNPIYIYIDITQSLNKTYIKSGNIPVVSTTGRVVEISEVTLSKGTIADVVGRGGTLVVTGMLVVTGGVEKPVVPDSTGTPVVAGINSTANRLLI